MTDSGMHLCVQTLPFPEPLEETLDFLEPFRIQSLDWRCDPKELLDNSEGRSRLKDTLAKHDVEIDIFGATAWNPLHPQEERASRADRRIRNSIRLAAQLDIDQVGVFAGTPGGSPQDRTPNWIVSPIPPGIRDGQFFDQYAEFFEYQWNEVALPYWEELSEFADQHDVDLPVEIHINTLVHSPPMLMKLHRATNDRIGAYVDPGHLMLQNIDPVETIRYLSEHDVLMHFEASDVNVYEENQRLMGTWDMTPINDPANRPWTFCTVGYGHGEEYWKKIISTLNIVGYDGPMSIQHLNTPESVHEGMEKAINFIDNLLIRGEPDPRD